jgi:hypothetical protein
MMKEAFGSSETSVLQNPQGVTAKKATFFEKIQLLRRRFLVIRILDE